MNRHAWLAVVWIFLVSSGLVAVNRPANAARRLSALGSCTAQAAGNVASGRSLASLPRAMVAVADSPFAVVTTKTGDWSFVSGAETEETEGGYVAVMSDYALAPTLSRLVRLPTEDAAGEALTPNGRYLIVAGSNFHGVQTQAVVLSVTNLEQGNAHPVVGALDAPLTAANSEFSDGGAIEIAVSKDGRFVFVSEESLGEVAVFNLHRALATAFSSSGYVGTIPVGIAPVGLALSPDGRTLYATSEIASSGSLGRDGTLSVISVAKAETRPIDAVVATVDARCSPVRVAVSPDGETVWVTARGSNQLLGYSAKRLARNPTRALLAAVRVGEQPVGVAVFDHGARVAVADSDRGNVPGRTSGITIVDAKTALDGSPSIVGDAPAGGFPRDLAFEPNGTTLLVANYDSGDLEAVDLQNVP